MAVEIKFEHGCPWDGIALIELIERDGWPYRGELIPYTEPDVEIGDEYWVTVTSDTATVKIDGNPVRITSRIPKTGRASVRITDISDEVYGRIESEIQPIDDSQSTDSSDVDITDVSKL